MTDVAELPAYRSTEEILAHPRFIAAREALVDATLKFYESDLSLNRLISEAGRSVLFVIIMCMSAKAREEDRSTWLTMNRIARETAAQGVGSARRVHDLVMRLVAVGYIELRLSKVDRRVHLVSPTPKMVARDQDWLIAHYQPLHTLFPEPGYGRIMRREPRFQTAQRMVAANFFAQSAQIFVEHPIMVQFMMREGGVMTLMNLMQLDRRGALADGISFTDFATRVGASRTQIRKILRDAELVGLLRISKGDPIVVELAPLFFQVFDRFVAAGMSGHDLIYQLTLQGAGAEESGAPAPRP